MQRKRKRGRLVERVLRWLFPAVIMTVFAAGITVGVLSGFELDDMPTPLAGPQEGGLGGPVAQMLGGPAETDEPPEQVPLLLMEQVAETAAAADAQPSDAQMQTLPPQAEASAADGAAQTPAPSPSDAAAHAPAGFVAREAADSQASAGLPVSASGLTAPGETGAPALRYAKAAAGVSFRSAASDTAAVQGTGAPGEALLITGQTVDAGGTRWLEVSSGTERGYVRADEVESITAEAFSALTAPRGK